MSASDPSKVVDFQTEAIGRLRARVDALGEANAVLLAYARGHAGAAAQIHAACLAAMDAQSLEHLVHVVTQDWVDILGLDAVAVALETSAQAVRMGPTGLQFLAPGALATWLDGVKDVRLEATPEHTGREGTSMFGPAATLIRSQALIRLPLTPPLPRGVLALGSRIEHSFEGVHGTELLTFLGAVTARCISRWLTTQP
ncbi:DUF484 family protein [Parapedomonas caeni]